MRVQSLCIEWLSQSVTEMNSPCGCATTLKAWTKTKLASAWEHETQVEAMRCVNDMFPNLVMARAVDVDDQSAQPDDGDAAWLGNPFMDEGVADDAWMGWIGGFVEDDMWGSAPDE